MKERVIELAKQGLKRDEIFAIIKSEGLTTLVKSSDKITLPQRRRWVRNNLNTLNEQADAPTIATAWTKADQPVQYLKAIKDYTQARNCVDDGFSYRSSVSVDLDATCSGLQIYAMMYRDKMAAHGVNVSPSECVQDIYGTVAVEMVKIIESVNAKVIPTKISEWVYKEDEKDEKMTPQAKLKAIKELGETFIKRDHTKRIVMTLTYGLTNFGIMEYSDEAVESIGESKFTFFKAAKMAFAKIVTEALSVTADCAVRGMLFTQKIAKYCASNNIGMEWTTPMGFKAYRSTEGVTEDVIQLKTTKRDVQEDSAGNKTVTFESVKDRIVDFKKTGQLSAQKMSSAVAPDLVHSLDAALLMKTVKKAHAMGVTKFKLVHDSFGTTCANIPKLNLAIREAAIEISEGNYFREWAVEVTKSMDWEECKTKVNDWKGDEYISDRDVEQGDLDVNSIKSSQHFFS